MFAVLPATLLATLPGRSMAEHFGTPALWLRDDLRIKLLALAIIGSAPVASGLLVHADLVVWWFDGHERIAAVASAALLAGGAIALTMQRAVGLLLMFPAACTALGLATEAMFRLHRPHFGVVGYAWYGRPFVEMTLSTFVPGALVIFAAMLALTPAMWRFVRDARG
jgi:hypothetical protein